MSLFNDDLVSKDITLSERARFTSSWSIIDEKMNASLSEKEEIALWKAIGLHIKGKGYICYSDLKRLINIIISPEEPKDKDTDTDILGIYETNNDSIILYINNIRKVSKENDGIDSEILLVNVFAHELYHAYFKTKSTTIKEIEEPIAELGGLLFLFAYLRVYNVRNVYIDFYKKLVKNKKEKKGIAYYALGANLLDIFDNKKDFISAYKKVNNHPLNVQKVNEYKTAIADGKFDEAIRFLESLLFTSK